jgi:lysozyme
MKTPRDPFEKPQDDVEPKNNRVPFGAAPLALVAALVASLFVWEGRPLEPYWDKLGRVWTVCAGVTGPGVVPGRRYTEAECDALEQGYVRVMLERMGRCVPGDLPPEVVKAFGHFAYNVGEGAFCSSTAAKKLREGDLAGACAQITRWTFVGGKDCRLASSRCSGIVKRREWERATCEAGL